VQPANGADWLVRASGKNVVLAPGSGWPDSRAPFGEPAFGPAPIDGDLANWLKDALSRIARAEYLTRFAATSDLGGTYTSIHVNLAITRVTTRNENGKENIASIPIAWPAPDVLAYDEDLLVFDLANKGRVPIDITAFYINSGFGIKCLYPRQGNLNRLLPEESLAPWLPLRFDNKTVGLEHLVVIATKANGQPVDFSLLEQPTLEQALNKAGTRSGAFAQSLDTPLGKLLQRGMFGEGQSRGATWQQIEDYVVFAVSFNVRPGKRPTNPKLVENRGISHESAGTDRSLVLR